jgi:hypothetical protein
VAQALRVQFPVNISRGMIPSRQVTPQYVEGAPCSVCERGTFAVALYRAQELRVYGSVGTGAPKGTILELCWTISCQP